MTTDVSLLVVAKAPVPGLAKTRLCPPATPEEAADVAAAALLDTLDAVLNTPNVRPVVALTGALREARRSAEISDVLRHFTVIAQRGVSFADRLANAHADTHRAHHLPVFQIGMDTPQVTPLLLAESAERLAAHHAVLGPAADGGWWALGLNDPTLAGNLRIVPMSRPDTGAYTLMALGDRDIGMLPLLSDVDDMATARQVAATVPHTRFAAALAHLGVPR